MAVKPPNPKIFVAALTASLCIGLACVSSGALAYHLLLVKNGNSNPQNISDGSGIPVSYNTSTTTGSDIATQNQTTSGSQSSSVVPPAGSGASQSPAATTKTTTPPSPVTPAPKYCSGENSNIPDGVCEAILSVQSDPTTGNPHISSQAAQSLALMPPGSTAIINEQSWSPVSQTSGSINIVLQTSQYGDVNVLLQLDLQGTNWAISKVTIQ